MSLCFGLTPLFLWKIDAVTASIFHSVMQLLDAQALQIWDDIDICPRTCLSSNVTLCTYHRWFARPACVRHTSQLLQQRLSARCLRTLLKFKMGCHSLANVSGRWARVTRPQRFCMRCAQQVIGDECHLAFECPDLQCVRDRYPGLFGYRHCDDAATHVAVGHCWCCTFVMDCFGYLDAASSSNQP